MEPLLSGAQRLHRYLMDVHWNGRGLTGPDPGIRFNARVGRFVKSYTPFLPWRDDLAYLQAQGYWIVDNWLLWELLGSQTAREAALACSDFVLASQDEQGFWAYPNPEWAGRVATVEGCWAALGLLASFERTRRGSYLDGAVRWHRYLVETIGFRSPHGLLAVNYFAPRAGATPQGSVPNNSTLVLWLLARLAEATGDAAFLDDHAPPMVEWLARVQEPSGELPYASGNGTAPGRPHFLCYQYNAFEFIDLANYHRITRDGKVLPVLGRLASYLETGFTSSGAARYDCSHDRPEVIYYTSAVARAVSEAASMRLTTAGPAAERAFARVLGQQREGGGFALYSTANYGWLSDRRSYPRYLAMTLDHLLQEHLSRLRESAGAQVDRARERTT